MMRCSLLAALVMFCGAVAPLFAQSINPADYGTITLHLKAEDLALADGAAVTAWGPLTSSGTNAPVFVASSPAFNGRPVVRFDGVNDYMAKTEINLPARTVFAVVTLESGARSLAGLLSDGADGLNIRRQDSGFFYNGQNGRQNADDFTGHPPAGRLLVNGSPETPYTPGVAHLVIAEAGGQKIYPTLRLGHPGNSLQRYWRGGVAELIVYDGLLTEDGMNRVGWYLREKYGLEANFPAPAPEIRLFTATAAGPVTSAEGVVSAAGAPVTLSWRVRDAVSLSIDQGALAATGEESGSVTVSPETTTTYTLTAVNAHGSSERRVTVHVGVTPLPPVLTEFAAQSEDEPLDEDGDPSDWIEIYNPNPYAIDLHGWKLRDGGAEWAFPPGSGVEVRGFRLVFASGKNRNDPAANLHASFALSARGEYLGLARVADGAVVSEFAPAYPPQQAGRSYGVYGDPPRAGYFTTPTPGAPNAEPGVAGFLEETGGLQVSAGRGFYTGPVVETLSAAEPGSTIVYTNDGSTPSETNGVKVLPPNETTPPSLTLTIHPGAAPEGAEGTHLSSIGGVTTLRVVLVKEGYMPSKARTHTYLFTREVLGQTAADARTKGWPSRPVNGQLFDYGMDPNAVAAYPLEEMVESLHSIPTLSLVTDFENLTDPARGIYVNALEHGGEWERPVSAELIFPPGYQDPDGNKTGFQINAGIRIRGGYSRNDEFFKHGLRLYFSKKYEGKLRYRMFGGEGTAEFGKLDFGTGSNYGWYRESSYSNGRFNTMCRDMFCRDTQGAMGQPYTKSRFYHLYLNGHYWGVYYSEERAEAEFAASYMGGDDKDYDAVKCGNHVSDFQTEATDGTLDAWRVLWEKVRAIGNGNTSNAAYFEIQGRNPDGTRNPELPVLLDVDNLIDEMLVIFYSGDGDAVLSSFLGHNKPNNWFSVFRRDGAHGFRFFIRDAEHTLGAPSWVVNQTGPWGGSNKTNFAYSNPQWMHEDLMRNAEYKLRFADHVHRHFFNDGALTPARCVERFQRRANQVEKAMKAESARWGDAQSITGLPAGHPRRYTPEDWTAAINLVKNNIMPGRTATVLGQLRADGLYPSVAAAEFKDHATGEPRHGGEVAPGFQLAITAPAGAVYYTLDGSDPRSPATNGPSANAALYAGPVALNKGTRVNARVLNGGQWSALASAYFIVGAVPATAENLTISQLHYNPLGGSDYEYIEFLNIGTRPVDLTGVRVREGVAFDFPEGTVLEPGGRLQVVSNPAAFATLYADHPTRVAGAYEGNLSNSGERLLITSDTRGVVKDFDYSDTAPWPEAADGDGFALELSNPFANPALGEAANWRASATLHGAPGRGGDGSGDNGPVFTGNPAADADGDGLSALLEYALGTSDTDASSGPGAFSGEVRTLTVDGATADYAVFTVTMPRRLASVDYEVEVSDGLGEWRSGADKVVFLGEEPAAGDRVTRSWRAAGPVTSAGRLFLRLKVRLK